jgi:hypothetical protein
MPQTAITIPKIGNISHQKSRKSSTVIRPSKRLNGAFYP